LNQRFEIKFILGSKHLELVRARVSSFCKLIKIYDLNSLYFDDPGLSFLNAKLDGHYERKKIRIRTYSKEFLGNNCHYLECKKRIGEHVFKTREEIGPDEIQKSINGVSSHPWLIGLLPQIHVSYNREEYGFNEGRITIDNHIFFQSNTFSQKYLNAVMEYKSKTPIDPNLFRWINNISKMQSFSKYATGMNAMLGRGVF